tara:strand:+ start:141 stop:263 length:123 start_codon:yes stop_codon:yes gene_type:complete
MSAREEDGPGVLVAYSFVELRPANTNVEMSVPVPVYSVPL